MPGRITGPYKGFFINASASLSSVDNGQYVGSISLTENSVDQPRKLEQLVDLGDVSNYVDEQSALESLEAAARDYIDEWLPTGEASFVAAPGLTIAVQG
jgi:hypothetical protein